MAAQRYVEGFDELRAMLRELRIQKPQITKMAQQSQKLAARPLVFRAQRLLLNSPVFKRFGTSNNGYSKLVQVAKFIASKTLKGPVTAIQVNKHAPTVNVQGSKRPKWTTYGWAHLLAKGRGGGREGRKNWGTGYTQGAGDYVAEAADQVGGAVLVDFKKRMVGKLNTYLRMLNRKHGR